MSVLMHFAQEAGLKGCCFSRLNYTTLPDDRIPLNVRDLQHDSCMLPATMSWKTLQQRGSRKLAICLLAFVVGAQFGLVGHQHTDGQPVLDCFQCQFDHGKAVLSSKSLGQFNVPADTVHESATLAGTASAHHFFDARGPPFFS